MALNNLPLSHEYASIYIAYYSMKPGVRSETSA